MDLTALQTKTRFVLGEVSTDNYTDANLNRALNDYYHRAVNIAIQANGQWEVNGDYATANLVQDQQEYVLEAAMLAIKSIEVNMTGLTNNWVKLRITDLRNIPYALTNLEDTDDRSEGEFEVRLFDNSIFFLKPPKTSVTAGIKIYYNKEATELSTGTDEPMLTETAHTYLVHGASLDYCLRIKDTEEYKKYKALVFEDEHYIKKFYTNRLPMVRTALQPKKEYYN